MVFSSPIFLFLFLPLVLAYFFIPGRRWRDYWLLGFSVLFYAWGEVVFVFLMLASAGMNYLLGRWVDAESNPVRRKWAVGIAVLLNIGTLAYFKYANFVVDNLNDVLRGIQVSPLHFSGVRLPIGISFFTFHALSYVIDIYRRKSPAAKNPCDTALYIFFFPQLIAGPILRWNAMAPQFANRMETREKFAEGIRRFTGGLAKKVLIANVVGRPADLIFALPKAELNPALAWFGVICYTLQIYFDFSGYSDMAVGLGKMFGFEFMENFNYPYISQSIKEFWRRWHISLSSWFRDYLYIPLGGNRGSEGRTYGNLLLVFFLCGLWHGASWTFVVWGLYHGLFLALERLRWGAALERLPRPVAHAYALLVVMVGWTLFRADTFAQALVFLQNMAGFPTQAKITRPLAVYLTRQVGWSIVFGVIFSTPAWPRLRSFLGGWRWNVGPAFELAATTALLLVSAAWLAGSTYNPFIYFRF